MQVNDRNRFRRDLLALGLACFALQLALAPQFSLGNGHVNFCLILALCISLTQGGRSGVLAGFFAGLVFDLAGTGPVGLMALLLTVCSFVTGFQVRNRLAEDRESSLLVSAIACLAVCGAHSLVQLAMGQTAGVADALFLRALPDAVLSFVFFLPFAAYLGRMGRTGLGLGGASSGKVIGPGGRRRR